MLDAGTKLVDDGTKITKFPYVFGQEIIQNMMDGGTKFVGGSPTICHLC
jgi:hypothetical protein